MGINPSALTIGGSNLTEAEYRKRLFGEGTSAAATAATQNPYYDSSGRPIEPIYNSLLAGGNLPDYLRSDTQAYNQNAVRNTYDPKYMEKVWSTANDTNASPWLQAALNQQGLDEAAQLDKARALSEGSVAGARANMAMRGGMGSGSSERLGVQGMNNLMAALQGVRGQGASARAGLQTQEMTNKYNLLQQLPQLEQGRSSQASQIAQFNEGQRQNAAQMANQASQFNIANILSENQRAEQAKQDAYKARMAAWGAGKTADATSYAAEHTGGLLGSGGILGTGCFLTTAVCGHFGYKDDGYILNSLRHLRDYYMKPDQERNEYVKEYYKIAPKIVEKIKKDPERVIIYNIMFLEFIMPTVCHIENARYEEAFQKYSSLVTYLKDRYEE